MTRRGYIVMAVTALVLVGGVMAWRARTTPEEVRTVQAERQTVRQEVAFTGRLQAAEEVRLGFESGGTLRHLAVQSGQLVEAGEVVAILNPDITSLEVAQAAAARASGQQAALLAFQNAEHEWNNVKTENAQTVEVQKQAVRDAKREMDQAQDVWQTKVAEDGEDASTTKAVYSTWLTRQSAYRAAQATLEKLLATTARTNQLAEDATRAANEQYMATLQAAGNIAGLSALEATEKIARVRLSQRTMTAPISGMITRVEADQDEYVTAGSGVIEIQTTDNLEIVADVTETDAAKIAAGMRATIDFDALSERQEWTATVSTIAPAASLIEGVPTYEVTLRLEGEFTALKPGYTANVRIAAAERDNVVAVPRRALIERDNRQFVQVQRGADEGVAEQEVSSGLIGSEGLVEITSGLSGGETIVIPSLED